jgi:hypothetical protein
MSGTSVGRPIGGILAILGGLLLLGSWGLYASLWTLLGVVLGCAAMFGGAIIFKEEYVRGGTMSLIAAIISWGLYPTHPLSGYLLFAVGMMAAGGVLGLILELSAE